MRLTNQHDLPQTLVNAIERDPYNMGDARMSVTGLLRPPRITLLTKRHAKDITTDVVDHIWSLMGRAVHKLLEDGGDEHHLTEERLFAEVRGWRISGQLDLQKLGPSRVAITDYKNTSVYAVMHEKREWSEQLNAYAWLIRAAKGWDVQRLSICAIMRDWNRHKAGEDRDYPTAPVQMITIPVWPAETAAGFVEGRVKLHQQAIAGAEMGEEPPACSDEERWMRADKYLVFKWGNKRPTRVFETLPEANVEATKRGDAYSVKHQPGEPVRCTNNYCQVAPYCRQYAQWRKEHP